MEVRCLEPRTAAYLGIRASSTAAEPPRSDAWDRNTRGVRSEAVLRDTGQRRQRSTQHRGLEAKGQESPGRATRTMGRTTTDVEHPLYPPPYPPTPLDTFEACSPDRWSRMYDRREQSSTRDIRPRPTPARGFPFPPSPPVPCPPPHRRTRWGRTTRRLWSRVGLGFSPS